MAVLCFWLVPSAWAETDLIDEGKTDSAIKMLVFPKSMRVIESQANPEGEAAKVLLNARLIRKTLFKVDPARVAPVKAGDILNGVVTRDGLRKLGKKYSEDVIFIFRRNVKLERAFFIRYQGLLYLTRQKKVLALKGNVKEGNFDSPRQQADRMQEMDLAGLKSLAQEARKVLQSHKFEKRQSAY